MTDILVLAVIALIVGGAALYIYKAKKSGVKCVGCPHAKTCSSIKHTRRTSISGHPKFMMFSFNARGISSPDGSYRRNTK